MLTIPSVHPFLMRLLTTHASDKEHSIQVPLDSWKHIIQESITQRVAPLLHQWLAHNTYLHQIPHQSLVALKHHVMSQAAWNLRLTNALREILTTCEQQGIACIPIRGPVLEEHLYGDSSIRQMDDLDILVHYEDLSAVKGMFRHLGYMPYEHRPGFLETFSYSLEFIHPHHNIVVEPHWTLAYPPFTHIDSMHQVWERAVRHRWMGMTTSSLSHEDLLLHLCLHLSHKKQQAPLLWFYELDTVIQRHGATLNWSVFINQVELMEQTASVADVLMLLREQFHSAIPDSVVTHLTHDSRKTSVPSPSTRRTQILIQSSLHGREEFAHLCSLRSLPQQLRYLSALLFPSPQYMRRRYGISSRISLIGSYIARFFHLGIEGLRCAAVWIGTIVATRPSSSIHQ